MAVAHLISSRQAFEAAAASIQSRPYRTSPGDIIIQPKDDHYEVTFLFRVDPEKDVDHAVHVYVSDSGAVTQVIDDGVISAPRNRTNEHEWQGRISPERAYDLALQDLNGFEDYDKMGRLTVELRGDLYYVTFPLARTLQRGSRGPDYAIQVQLDAHSGKLLKKLVAP